MKKSISILVMLFSIVAFSQNQTLTGIKTFTSPPKFLNLAYSGTNTKFLTLSGANQLQWSTVSPITPTPQTFQQTLTAGSTSTSGGVHFTLTGSGKTGLFFSDAMTYENTTNGANASYGASGYDNNNNDGRQVQLGYSQGLVLKTSASGYAAALKSTNLTAARSFEYPNASGTLALTSDIPSPGGPVGGSTITVINNTYGDLVLSNGGDGLTLADESTNKILRVEPAKLEIYKSDGTTFARFDAEDLVTTSRTQYLTNADGKIPILGYAAPSSATDTGVMGEIRASSTYVYVCVAPNTWVRAALSTW